MNEKTLIRSGRRGEAGFALVLAILALMLLTFLGLTMAATTSTELQIATNYRWSQQALYNAEAGLEAAKVILAGVGPVGSWTGILPTARAGDWDFGNAPPPVDPVTATRDYERMGPTCNDRSGLGYGRVLTVGGIAYENVSTYPLPAAAGNPVLNGAFTLWIRRDVSVNNATGRFADSTVDSDAVIVSEGIAPYTSSNMGVATGFSQVHRAARVLETAYSLVTAQQSKRCQTGLAGQEGLAATGENFDPCSPLTASGIDNALGRAAGTTTENAGVK